MASKKGSTYNPDETMQEMVDRVCGITPDTRFLDKLKDWIAIGHYYAKYRELNDETSIPTLREWVNSCEERHKKIDDATQEVLEEEEGQFERLADVDEDAFVVIVDVNESQSHHKDTKKAQKETNRFNLHDFLPSALPDLFTKEDLRNFAQSEESTWFLFRKGGEWTLMTQIFRKNIDEEPFTVKFQVPKERVNRLVEHFPGRRFTLTTMF